MTNFPPIIRTTKTNENYVNLLKNYLKQYLPESGIIYRLLSPDEKLIKRFIKQKYTRIDYLSRFTESCDCCFPLWIKLKRLNNIYSLKYWLDNEEFNKNEMLIPNLKFFEKKKTNVIKGQNKTNKTEKNKIDVNKQNDKAKNVENEMRKKSLTIMANNSIVDNKLQDNLNRLKIEKPNPPYLEDYSYNVLSTNAIFGD